MNQPEEHPGQQMKDVIAKLANSSNYRDKSGIEYAPITIRFPALIAQGVDKLSALSANLYFQGQTYWQQACALSRVRKLLIDPIGHDITQNHTQWFLDGHPEVARLSETELLSLRFNRYFQQVMNIDNPISCVALLTQLEKGAEEEIFAFGEANMVNTQSEWYVGHVGTAENSGVEEAHGQAAMEIERILLAEPTWRTAFEEGIQKHRCAYEGVIAS